MLGIFLVSCLSLFAQQDSSYNLVEVKVSAVKRTQQVVGTRVDLIDSIALKQSAGLSLAEVLSQHSGVFIKNYGPGTLASSSLRGGNASHTQLYWGNLNIQNPMLGQNDFSLFPALFFDNIQIAYGGIGGIYLNNQATLGKGLESKVLLAGGSFDNKQIAGSFSFSGQRSVTVVKAFHKSVENNFPFLNTYSEPQATTRLTHANHQQNGLIAEHTQFFASGLKLGIKAWFQQADRELPPTMAQKTSEAIQKDDSQRLMAELSRIKEYYSWILSSAFFSDHIFYQDEVTRSDSRSNTNIQQLEVKKWWKHNQQFLFRTKINNSYTVAITDNYGAVNPQQNRTLAQFTGEYQSDSKKLFVQLGAKQEFVPGKNTPLCPILGFEWKPAGWLGVLGNASRVYRLPTFNDQFWVPGGKPNLLPENGYAQEIGLKLSAQKGLFSFEETTTLFNKNIQNWIIWLPGNTYWSPQNLMSVWSRGVETKWKVSRQSAKSLISLSVLTNYVVSTNQRAKLEGDESVGKQLIYTPLYTGQANLSISHRDFTLLYNQSYTGYTYTSSDNLNWLTPYNVANTYLSKKIAHQKFDVTLGFQCLNLWNVNYQAVAIRPMPGRNYLVSLIISFRNTIKPSI